MTTPMTAYHHDLTSNSLIADPSQAQAMMMLERLYQQLKHRSKFWHYFRYRSLRGLYLWGPVGSGKTYLLDSFYRCLTAKKLRYHFHQFMSIVHNELTKLQGYRNPVNIIAKAFARQAQVICFDEFLVNNIVDAMLLGQLLSALFKHGICLVATSNNHPDTLYDKGLQRALFLPTIKLLKQHVNMVEVNHHIDYRLWQLTPTDVYFCPADKTAKQNMCRLFQKLSGKIYHQTMLTISNRSIAVLKLSDRAVWFEFSVICQPPRCYRDYLTIAQRFDAVFISNLNAIASNDHNTISLFINMVDIFYDAKVALILTSDVPITKIYTKGQLQFEFKRTQSRLMAMQSQQYLCKVKNQHSKH